MLPSLLSDLLATDLSLDGGIRTAVAEFMPILDAAPPPFFPEYTDHGTKHIHGVLQRAVSLMSDESASKLTAEDAAVLVLAVLLHDLGMHIRKDGLIALLAAEPNSLDAATPFFRDKPWDYLWEEFAAEARRFSGQQNYSLFGDPEPVEPP